MTGRAKSDKEEEKLPAPGSHFAFTQTLLAKLPKAEAGKRDMYYDSRQPFLALRVTETGTKTFLIYRRLQGSNPLKRSIGKFPDLKVDEARNKAEEINAQLKKGDDPLARRRKEKMEITLGELFSEYLENHAKVYTKRWRTEKQRYDQWLSHWSGKKVSAISRRDVQQLLNAIANSDEMITTQRKKKGVVETVVTKRKKGGKISATRTKELLRAIINRGRELGIITCENPAAGRGIYSAKPEPRKRFLNEDEIQELLKAAKSEENKDVGDFVQICIYTGMRKQNVLEMRWEQLDLKRALWTIPDTKNGTTQSVPLTQNELTILQRRFRDRKTHKEPTAFEWVFPGPGESGHMFDPKKGWDRIRNAAELPDVVIHDLRRSLGSWMAMTGASLSVIGDALGHKDVSTTRRVYAQTQKQAELEARRRAHERMTGKSSNVTKLPKGRKSK